MAPVRFGRYELRAKDVVAARAFYDAVLGHHGDGIIELPAAAIARGAPPHWMGHLDVSGIGGAEAIGEQLFARGGRRLGPPRPGASVLLQGPGGPVFALTEEARGASGVDVAWHQLWVEDAAHVAPLYAELFGWSLGPELRTNHGRLRDLAFASGEPPFGAVGDVAEREGVHTQWLYFFAVPSIDAAAAEVRARGGLVFGPSTMEDGRRLAACDDPQGAAFGLIERA
jgi:predicted enzyme related to lactoylglutathione lyase